MNYEEFVARSDELAPILFEHVQLPWDDSFLQLSRKNSRIRTASYAQARQSVNQSGLKKWQPYEAHFAPHRELFARALENYSDFIA